MVIELAGTVLVDRREWVLLQERDEHAPVAPNQRGPSAVIGAITLV